MGRPKQRTIDISNLKPGQKAYLRIRQQSQKKALLLTGSETPAGFGYLFYFPFDIHVSVALGGEQVIHIDGTKIIIYPPFRSKHDNVVVLPQIDMSKVPSATGVAHPYQNDDYQEGFTATVKINEEDELADGLRIDIYIESEEDANKLANEVFQQFVGLVRWHTRQWWVGRGYQHLDSYKRHTFMINESGERVREIISYAVAQNLLGVEISLSKGIFYDICLNIQSKQYIPSYWDTLYDAVYSRCSGQMWRSIIEATTACEMYRDVRIDDINQRESHAKSAGQIEGMFPRNKLIEHLDKGMQKFVGRSFKTDNPQAFEHIQKLWTARGNIAHGRAPTFRSESGERQYTDDDLFVALDAVFQLFSWLQKL